MAKYTRKKSTDFTKSGGKVDQRKLWSEVETATTKPLASITELDDEDGNVGDDVEFDFGAVALDAGQQTTLTTTCNAHGFTPLVAAKRAKVKAIDLRTKQLIGKGFEHPAASGDFYSLSIEAQATFTGIYAARNDSATITYPIKINKHDVGAPLSLANATQVEAFFRKGVKGVRAHRDSGTALRDEVRVATTIAEVDAVVDNR